MENNIEIGDFPLPQQTYTARCIGCIFKTSQKGNPMYEQTWEITTPTANWRGKTYKCAGLQFTNWLTLTEKGKDNNEKFLKKMQLQDVSLDANNPTPEKFLGIGASVALVGAERRHKSKVENADGSFTEEDLLDADGKPVVTYNIELLRSVGFLGRNKAHDAAVSF